MLARDKYRRLNANLWRFGEQRQALGAKVRYMVSGLQPQSLAKYYPCQERQTAESWYSPSIVTSAIPTSQLTSISSQLALPELVYPKTKISNEVFQICPSTTLTAQKDLDKQTWDNLHKMMLLLATNSLTLLVSNRNLFVWIKQEPPACYWCYQKNTLTVIIPNLSRNWSIQSSIIWWTRAIHRSWWASLPIRQFYTCNDALPFSFLASSMKLNLPSWIPAL